MTQIWTVLYLPSRNPQLRERKNLTLINLGLLLGIPMPKGMNQKANMGLWLVLVLSPSKMSTLALEWSPLPLYAIIPHYVHEYGSIGTEGPLLRHLVLLHVELHSDVTEDELSRLLSRGHIRNHFMTIYMLDLQGISPLF